MYLPVNTVRAALAVLAMTTGAAADLRTVVVDGFLDDWAGASPDFTDPAGDHGGGTTTVDWRAVYAANNAAFFYLRFQTGNVILPQNSPQPFRIYLDVDDNAATGWAVGGIGSDLALLMPERRWIEQSAGQFEAANIGHGPVDSVIGPTHAGSEFEVRVRRDVLFPIRGTPLLPGPTVRMLLEAGNGADRAPNGNGGHLYTMAAGSPPPWPETGLGRHCPADLRVLHWNMLWDGIFERPEVFERILQALDPDILCFNEINQNAAALRAALDDMLPLGGGATWQVYRGFSNAIAAPWTLTLTANDTIPSTQRQQAMALVNLPDAQFPVDLYLISAHYRCCGSQSGPEEAARQRHSDANVNWLRDIRTPGGNINLPSGTPVIVLGDFNIVGGPQPLATLITGDIVDNGTFGPDGPPDWDGTHLTDLRPLHNAGPAAHTWRDDGNSFMPGRLDFIVLTDSVLRAVKTFVLNTGDMSPASLAAAGLLPGDSALASDHYPVVVDLRFTDPADVDLNGAVNSADVTAFVAALLSEPGSACLRSACDFNGDRNVDGADVDGFVAAYLN